MSPKEATGTANLYVRDIKILQRFMEAKGKNAIPTFADAARIVIEYANAHGVLV